MADDNETRGGSKSSDNDKQKGIESLLIDAILKQREELELKLVGAVERRYALEEKLLEHIMDIDERLTEKSDKDRKKSQEKYSKQQISDLEKLAKKKRTEQLDELRKNREEAKQQLKDLEENHKKDSDYLEKKLKLEKDRREAEAEIIKQSNEDFMLQFSSDELLLKLDNLASGAVDLAAGSINSLIKFLEQNFSKMTARLLGTDKSYTSISKMFQGLLTLSPYVSMQTVMSKALDLVDKGIAYNVEQRAFLLSISDKIATTFEVLNGTLLKIIRIQQADSTAARLGMESYLTQFLNNMFEDSSYLGLLDAVRDLIYEAETQLSKEESLQFEYITQKWLGSLYSVGASQGTISTIASGLNLLGTGNVQQLSGNTALQTLLAMSSSRAGLSYSDILTGGLSAGQTNTLLKSMVEYLQEIAESNNQVVKLAYSDLLGISMSDLQALQNLNSEDLNNIYTSVLAYGDMLEETNNQLRLLPNRMHIDERINNAFENVVWNLGTQVAESPFGSAMWKLTDLFEKGGIGDIHLPLISVLGNMIDLSSFTVNGILRGGIIGASALGTIADIVRSMGANGGLDLSAFGLTDTVTRGTGMILSRGGIQGGTSLSAYVGSGSSEDMQQSSVAETKESSKKMGLEDDEHKQDYSASDIYKKLFIDRNLDLPVYVVSNTDLIVEKLYNELFTTKTPVNVNIINDYIKTKSSISGVDSMLSTIAKSLSNSLSNSLQSSLYGESDKKSDEEPKYTLNDLILLLMANISETEGVSVSVRNQNFDTAMTNLSRPNYVF